MAKYRRYRKYSRRSHAKWSPNIQEINETSIIANPLEGFYQTFVLAFNPTQTNTSVSQVFTVKNIDVNFYIDSDQPAGATDIEDVCAYIMFVPQGMTVTGTYNLDHPEYILNYKYLGGPSADSFNTSTSSTARIGQHYQPLRVRSRLSRKLQSGDNVILFIKGTNTGGGSATFKFHGLIRWWTRAN